MRQLIIKVKLLLADNDRLDQMHDYVDTTEWKAFENIVMAAIIGVALRLTGECQDKWTRSTDDLSRKHRDINEQLL